MMMTDIFENFLRCFIGDKKPKHEDTPECENSRHVTKYDSDIKALQKEYGDLRGQMITIELKNLLKLCPRERHRIEAYQGLKTTLLKEYLCVLKITSQKTKSN